MKNRRILISGAGIAGFTLAYWLKRRGFTPTIVEKHHDLRKGGYRVDVRGTALEVAKRMGVYRDLLDASVNILRSKFVTPGLKVLEFDRDLLGHHSEGEVEVNRWDLANILAKALGETEIIYSDSITKIEERVHFEKMAPREFDLVIGADGLHSNVRRLAFGDDSKFLRRYGLHFCVFPISNIFDLDHCEMVYFRKGRFVAAYAADQDSHACLAFKSEEETLPSGGAEELFEEQFKDLGWEVPRLISEMKSSSSCIFNSIAQVRMPCWSKGRVALVGDVAHAASSMGTSLSMVGAYVLARELEKAEGDYPLAFDQYEKSIRQYVEDAQDLAESDQQMLTQGDSSIRLRLQGFLMRIFPKRFLQIITKKGKERMKRVANALTLDPVT